MKIQIAIGGLALIALSGCGGGSGGGGTTYTLTSGSYRLSGVSILPPDNCNLGNDPDLRNGSSFQISVSGSNATFIVGQSADPNHDPVVPIQGNTLNAGSKTFDDDHNQDPAEPFDCVETLTVMISGTLTGQNQIQGSLVVSSNRKSGTCRPTDLNYKTHPCTSTLNFTATKT